MIRILAVLAVAAIVLIAFMALTARAASQTQTFTLGCTVTDNNVTCTGSLPVAPTGTAPAATATSLPATPTAVAPTATAIAPTPTGTYGVAQLLADSTGPHDGTLCNPPASYDWGQHGRIHPGVASGAKTLRYWSTAQWRACGASSAGVTIEVRNSRVLVWDGAKWQQLGGSVTQWCATTDPTTSGGYGGCTAIGSAWAMPQGQRAIHWASFEQTLPPGTQCAVVLLEARSNGAVMLNTGLDWYGDGGFGYIADAWFGTYRALGPDWRTVGGTNCGSALLTAHPPTW
ncbi:MAG TPA: hypothetical protein VFB20_10745 [Burkholderiales bacterium]|nr:hypothetical protein [Burkholderiales bacterium]